MRPSTPRSPSPSRQARSGSRLRRGGFMPARSSSPRSGSRHRRRLLGAPRGRSCGGCPGAARATRSSRPGAVLVVGGAPGTTGAPVLAAMAALRADAGYVTLCVPRDCLPVVEALALEPVKLGFDWEQAEAMILAAAERADAVAIGPGLGRSSEARALVAGLLARLELPVVVDADALFGLEPAPRAHPTVLTPHVGELARLLDREAAWVDAHRLAAARAAAERFGAVVLLKGADTIVQGPAGGPVVCDMGPPSLATAGTGDVLTGVRGRVPRQRPRPRHRRCRGRHRPRARGSRRAEPGRAHRERRRRGAAAGVRLIAAGSLGR